MQWPPTQIGSRSPTRVSVGKTFNSQSAGSWTVANPDAIVRHGGSHRYSVHRRLHACCPCGQRHQVCADSIRLGDYDIGIAVGMDKHPRGAFRGSRVGGDASWYAQNGPIPSPPFFG